MTIDYSTVSGELRRFNSKDIYGDNEGDRSPQLSLNMNQKRFSEVESKFAMMIRSKTDVKGVLPVAKNSNKKPNRKESMFILK